MNEEDFAVSYNDVDFCLKLREKGYLIVYNPYIELIHYESKTRGYEITREKNERFENEANKFKSKWKKVLEKSDIYSNMNFSKEKANCTIKSEK